MLSILIDAHERRDVATVDVTGSYLRADMDDKGILKFTGEFVDILCSIKPEYDILVTIVNGVRVLCELLLKTMYRCVKSALLWYNLLTGTLKGMGFELIPYEPCMANCIVEGKQCTIDWYVDDTKISHVYPNAVTRVIEQIEAVFDKMKVTRGREYTYYACTYISRTIRQSSA
jgi:hypothetical protein